MNNAPYEQFKGLPVWSVLDQAIEKLVKNNDIKETTGRAYIVGFLVKALVESGITMEKKSSG